MGYMERFTVGTSGFLVDFTHGGKVFLRNEGSVDIRLSYQGQPDRYFLIKSGEVFVLDQPQPFKEMMDIRTASSTATLSVWRA